MEQFNLVIVILFTRLVREHYHFISFWPIFKLQGEKKRSHKLKMKMKIEVTVGNIQAYVIYEFYVRIFLKQEYVMLVSKILNSFFRKNISKCQTYVESSIGISRIDKYMIVSGQ
jgi:hypothetical protein